MAGLDNPQLPFEMQRAVARYFKADLMARLARQGDLKLIKWMRKRGVPWDETVTAAAAAKGYMNILIYLHNNGCPWDATATLSAARHNTLEALRYLHENGCPWVERCYDAAIARNNAAAVRYLSRHGCPCSIGVVFSNIRRGTLPCIEAILDNIPFDNVPRLNNEILRLAITAGDVGLVRYAHRRGGAFNAHLYDAAVRGHSLQVLRYLHANKCPRNVLYLGRLEVQDVRIARFLVSTMVVFDTRVYNSAVESGNVEMARYLDSINIEANHDTAMCLALTAGQVDVVEYLLPQVDGLRALDMAQAASSGSLRLVKYLHEQGVPWDARVFKAACQMNVFGFDRQRFGNRLPLLYYLRDNGCPCDVEACLEVALIPAIREFLTRQEHPMPA